MKVIVSVPPTPAKPLWIGSWYRRDETVERDVAEDVFKVVAVYAGNAVEAEQKMRSANGKAWELTRGLVATAPGDKLHVVYDLEVQE